ncbi:MAG: rhodanese-like domain-containing protein [Apibacter sp.]|jgi:phage shock protein E|uniref:Rhodanese-related sulfurtransferase n=1 Tax=Apibacter mensalis TaxID=1586267 RepID=A0A0X3ANI6_9FLAO|nr:rhodanese-like domain-containing protein [Apibacter mensalis]MCO6564154.1 rhodanese-like domain-containing protein [Apibacter sp.]CVK15717.1 Rhodanese-related sulfurtransferase [Apibacter mensalis]
MDLKEFLKKSTVTLLDVREKYELINEGHVEGAVLIPMNEVPSKIEDIRKFSTPIIVFCRSGIRSEKIVNYLKNKGFKEIYNGGGFKEINKLLNLS